MCAKDKCVMEGPSMGKLLNKDLYRSVYNNYARHTTWPILPNRPIPTTWSFLPSWPQIIRHFREWLTFATTGLKIHVIRINMSNTLTVPIRLMDRNRPPTYFERPLPCHMPVSGIESGPQSLHARTPALIMTECRYSSLFSR